MDKEEQMPELVPRTRMETDEPNRVEKKGEDKEAGKESSSEESMTSVAGKERKVEEAFNEHGRMQQD